MTMEKLDADIVFCKQKILKEQARLRRLERKKLEMENASIVADVRAMPYALEDFRAFMAKRKPAEETDED